MKNTKTTGDGLHIDGQIMNAIGDPIFVKDEGSVFVFVNDALCEMLGISRENIIGKTLGESLPKDQMDHFLEVDRRVLNTGKEDITEEPLTGADKKILTIITKKSCFEDKDGKKYLVGIITDVTDRKMAENKLAEKMADLEKMNQAMVNREIKMVEMKEELEKLKK